MLRLQDMRYRYVKKNKQEMFPGIGRTIIRAAVLRVFEHAFDKLASLPHLHEQIASEAMRKIKVILNVISAEPDDPVFLSAGQLLEPLEPQYAQPRLAEFDYGTGELYAQRAQHRLEAWRAEGWPAKYPKRAVKEELKERRKLLAEMDGLKKEEKLERIAQHREVVLVREMSRSNKGLGGIKELEEGNVDGEKASRQPGVMMRRERDEEGNLVVDETERDSDDWS